MGIHQEAERAEFESVWSQVYGFTIRQQVMLCILTSAVSRCLWHNLVMGISAITGSLKVNL